MSESVINGHRVWVPDTVEAIDQNNEEKSGSLQEPVKVKKRKLSERELESKRLASGKGILQRQKRGDEAESFFTVLPRLARILHNKRAMNIERDAIILYTIHKLAEWHKAKKQPMKPKSTPVAQGLFLLASRRSNIAPDILRPRR